MPAYLEVHNFSIKMSLELHGELTQLVHSEARGMDARGKQELPIWSCFQSVASRWELQVLNELNLSPAAMNLG